MFIVGHRPVAQAKDKNKKHDLSKWTYATIRDTINTSSGQYSRFVLIFSEIRQVQS